MSEVNPVVAKMQRFSAAYGSKMNKIIKELQERITEDLPQAQVDEIVRQVWAKYGVEKWMEGAIIEGVYGSAASVLTKTLAKETFATYLARREAVGGLINLRTVGRASRDIVTKTIRESLVNTRTWREAARDLTTAARFQADPNALARSLISQARKVYGLSGDEIAYAKYKREAQSLARYASGLAENDRNNLAKAYQRLANLTNESSSKQVERTIQSVINNKARYNAERVARTEMAQAYGDAYFSEKIHDDDVAAYQWLLSSRHEDYDICEFNANANLYGLGKGIYPKDRGPKYPAHPNCLCLLVDVFVNEVKITPRTKFSPEKANAFIKQLPAEKRKLLVGKNGKSFEDIKGWQGQGGNVPVVNLTR